MTSQLYLRSLTVSHHHLTLTFRHHREGTKRAAATGQWIVVAQVESCPVALKVHLLKVLKAVCNNVSAWGKSGILTCQT